LLWRRCFCSAAEAMRRWRHLAPARWLFAGDAGGDGMQLWRWRAGARLRAVAWFADDLHL